MRCAGVWMVHGEEEMQIWDHLLVIIDTVPDQIPCYAALCTWLPALNHTALVRSFFRETGLRQEGLTLGPTSPCGRDEHKTRGICEPSAVAFSYLDKKAAVLAVVPSRYFIIGNSSMAAAVRTTGNAHYLTTHYELRRCARRGEH